LEVLVPNPKASGIFFFKKARAYGASLVCNEAPLRTRFLKKKDPPGLSFTANVEFLFFKLLDQWIFFGGRLIAVSSIAVLTNFLI
jgi:hypothetical protein